MNNILKYALSIFLCTNNMTILSSVQDKSSRRIVSVRLTDITNHTQPKKRQRVSPSTPDAQQQSSETRKDAFRFAASNKNTAILKPSRQLEQFIQKVETDYKHLHNPDLHTPLCTRMVNTGISCKSVLSALCQHLKITACFTNTVGYYKTKHDFAAAILNCEEPDEKYKELKKRYRTYQETGTLDQHPGFAMLMRSMNKRNVTK